MFLRVIKNLTKWIAFEIIAILGAVSYVVLENSVPERIGTLLAGLVLLLLLASIGYGLLGVLSRHSGRS